MTVACGIEEKDREKAIRMSMVALWCVQDSLESRPPMSAVVKMLDGGVEIMPPTKPFNYLYAIGMNGLKPPVRDLEIGLLSKEKRDFVMCFLRHLSFWKSGESPLIFFI